MFDTPQSTTAGNQGIVSPTPPTQQEVEVGISNDSSTEIISGLKVGDQVVTRTIAATTAKTTTTAPSLFSAPGSGNRGATGGSTIRRVTGG